MRLGRYGADPLALYEWMPVGDLMGWIPALDHIQSADRLQQINLNAISAGNTSEEDSRRSMDYLNSMLVKGKPKRIRRKKGESPF